MKLVSMAQEPQEAKEEVAEVAAEATQPRYPYGLRLRLDEEDIEKLGWEDLPKVGTKCDIEAKGVVTLVSNVEGLEHTMMDVEIQLTDLGMEVGKAPSKSATEALYPEGGNKKVKGGY